MATRGSTHAVVFLDVRRGTADGFEAMRSPLIEAVKAHQPALVPSSVMMNGVVAAARVTV